MRQDGPTKLLHALRRMLERIVDQHDDGGIEDTHHEHPLRFYAELSPARSTARVHNHVEQRD